MTGHWWDRRPKERARPRLAQINRADGTVEPLAVAPTDDPMEFELTTLEGGPVTIRPGDHVWVDLIGPGQAVSLRLEEP